MVRNISSRRLNARNAGGEEYDKKRNAIRVAAAAVFREKGYDAASGATSYVIYIASTCA